MREERKVFRIKEGGKRVFFSVLSSKIRELNSLIVEIYLKKHP